MNRIRRGVARLKKELFPDAETREIGRLANLPRFQAGSTSLLGDEFQFVDAASFLSAWTSIQKNRIYEFQTDKPAVHIIDLGANIGLAIKHFLSTHQNASIVAFEPDPVILSLIHI